MQVFYGLPDAPLASESALTIGVFDGVHHGHQALIRETVQRAGSAQRLSGLMTFDPHPIEILAPQVPFYYLTSIAERTRLVESLGVDFLCVYPFTLQTAQTRARDFMWPLVERLRIRDLVIGHDFALGYKRQGNADFLRVLGAEWGFMTHSVEPLTLLGEVVSSTRIRKLVQMGQLPIANTLLGHPFSLSGILQPDLHLPTIPRQQLPAEGRYPIQLDRPNQPTKLIGTAHISQTTVQIEAGPVVQTFTGQSVRMEFEGVASRK